MVMNTEAPTSVAQVELNLLLAQLVELKAQIAKARAALGPLEGGLEQAKREYQDRTNVLLRQANRLLAEIGELDSQIRMLY